jgi:hypothetical protein
MNNKRVKVGVKSFANLMSQMTTVYGKKKEGYYPPALAGYDYNPSSDRYMKKCKSYQTRSAKGRCVGRKSKSGSRTASDLAAKAMKLKHKEGISLKEAWKRVRYGKKKEGYYPPALAGYDYNPSSDRYIKKCKSYQDRNEKGRCVGRKPKSGSRTASDLASKAMKLKHKEGISLKEAWKRVRYGTKK